MLVVYDEPNATFFYIQGNPERRQVQKSIRSPPQSPPPSGGVPYLYKWLCKFHVTLLAKVSEHTQNLATCSSMSYNTIHCNKYSLSSLSTFMMCCQSMLQCMT